MQIYDQVLLVNFIFLIASFSVDEKFPNDGAISI